MATNENALRLQAALADLVAAVARVANALADDTQADQPDFVNAKAIGISGRTLRRIVAEGAVEGFLVGREIVVRRDAWDRYIASKRVTVRADRPKRLRHASPDLARLHATGKVAVQ
jgi:hypothetical protein